MRRRVLVSLFAACLFISGCNSDGSEESTYEEMTSTYDTFSIAGIWDALDNDDEVNGTYILLQGEVYDVEEEVVTLMDSSTSRTVECTFDSDTDISAIAEDDVVTIGGICRFYIDDTSFPYLDDCDYFYVNG